MRAGTELYMNMFTGDHVSRCVIIIEHEYILDCKVILGIDAVSFD